MEPKASLMESQEPTNGHDPKPGLGWLIILRMIFI